MRKLRPYYFHWIIAVAIVIALNIIFSFFQAGIDLTQDKRYTISETALDYVSQLSQPLELTVYLDGDLPIGFKRLAKATENIANRYHQISRGNFSIKFEIPGEGLTDSSKALLFDSLQRIGIHPTNVKSQKEDLSKTKESLVFPGAILSGENGQVGIDFLEGQNNLSGLDALNNAESQLEYKITRAIKLLQRKQIPVVGYLIGNAEVLDLRIYDLVENVLKKEYGFGLIDIDSVNYIPKQFDVLLINKPMKPFTDNQKLKIDQYIMKGGKVVWALDNVYASMDSLEKSKGSFLSFDLGLNLDDLLFKYGARINRDLVLDLESDQMPSIVGNMGDQPQIQLMPWPYAPLIGDHAAHPVSRNLDKILTSFPQSIDTISSRGIAKNVLLSTSIYGRKIATPAMVEWNPIRTEGDLKNYNIKKIPIALLLEGKFISAYKNKISSNDEVFLATQTDSSFINASQVDNQMIVIADGDVFLNPISDSDGPLTMGSNKYTRIQFANKEFLKNCLFYITDGKEILTTRAKNFQLRLLDKEKLQGNESFWNFTSMILPVFFPLILMLVNRFNRKRRYSKLPTQ